MPSEESTQIVFVNWVHRVYPHLWDWLHHSPNGGYRNRTTGHKMKLMGTKPGFPDLVLYHPVGEFSGLAIEMKTETGTVRKNQTAWLERLELCGFSCHVCRSLDEAQRVLIGYIDESA